MSVADVVVLTATLWQQLAKGGGMHRQPLPCRASDEIGKNGLLPNGDGTGEPGAESGHLTGAFDRAGGCVGAVRKVPGTPDDVLSADSRSGQAVMSALRIL
jgi:hypothetical protein